MADVQAGAVQVLAQYKQSSGEVVQPVGPSFDTVRETPHRGLREDPVQVGQPTGVSAEGRDEPLLELLG
ncbi:MULTISPECIES: hypothetical protein [unclassified Streptomyces]|uniref:hypothetical protein n=1 Tax=unclassified Streptomyces TaxID=2593676 RepID=UPI000380DF2F|nr:MULTISPECIES: hypothetical protein [unclassified Streptomyces]MYR65452.1 hypothetical protein [Streptomyces sp. SID4939]MYS01394.1 hypothetical protein [Streptomyces sp. SID4940]MYT62524.1 hypothetical protein [Streptomyces sp. SID8357]MYT89331.1 hypothetical protein [Streptomyces sp. SID8360]MYW38246.1 hypothetical protein [Streptomyces sp. SID1]